MIIIGIDPGLAKTGFGIIDGARCIRYGVIDTPPDTPIQNRLQTIFCEIKAVFDAYEPDELAVERLFFSRNVTSAIEVSHARGVILLAASEYGLDVYDYTPNQVKQAVTGSGRADKKHVQKMVMALLAIDEIMPADAADAVAVALCHANARLLQNL
ncbi:MAG TPA: crossover junction endodeoxyribonuclease RuvC [Methanosarcinales archaeon]|nr:crossover junction endodeoxyribonuclease RuvC [Methanosarcinales archaeon]